MKRQNANQRLFALLSLLLLLAPYLLAECSIQEADKKIRAYYKAIEETFSQPNSGKSMLIWKKNVLPMIPEGTSEKNGFNFPNEPRLLFGSEGRQSLEPNKYFNVFNKNRLENIGTQEERQVLLISLSCEYGEIKAIPYPNCFADQPKDRCITVDYYEMNVIKTYTISEIATNAVKTYTLNDRIDVRKRDGLIASLQNEYGGGASGLTSGPAISQEEINYEASIIEATSAWNNGDYQKAYKLYRKIFVESKEKGGPIPARVCFHLGLMMYDQYKKRAVYDPELNKKKAGQYAVYYMKTGAQMKDEPEFAEQCYEGYYYMRNQD